MRPGDTRVIERSDFGQLFGRYLALGPTVRAGAIAYDELDSVADLPEGWSDEQDGDHYRLKRRNDGALFGYTIGPQSWKQFLHLPHQRLRQAERTATGIAVTEGGPTRCRSPACSCPPGPDRRPGRRGAYD